MNKYFTFIPAKTRNHNEEPAKYKGKTVRTLKQCLTQIEKENKLKEQKEKK